MSLGCLWIVVRANRLKCLASGNEAVDRSVVRRLVLVDESKARSYFMVATTMGHGEAAAVRRELRSLVLPGQRGLHMQSESARRRRLIITTITMMAREREWTIRLYDAGSAAPEKSHRRRCIEALVGDVESHAETHVVFDRDRLLESWDRQIMIEAGRFPTTGGRVTHEHQSRKVELLLAIPDALAWCWARGGPWRQQIREVVDDARWVG